MRFQINEQVPFISFKCKTSTPRFGNLYYPWEPEDKIIKIHLEMLTFVEKVQVNSEPGTEVFVHKFIRQNGDEFQMHYSGDRAHLTKLKDGDKIDWNDENTIIDMETLEEFFGTILRGLRDFKEQSESSDSIEERTNAKNWLPALQKHYDDMVELVAKELKLKVIAGYYKFGDRVSHIPKATFEPI